MSHHTSVPLLSPDADAQNHAIINQLAEKLEVEPHPATVFRAALGKLKQTVATLKTNKE